MENKVKKDSKTIVIFIIIVLILVLIIGALFYYITKINEDHVTNQNNLTIQIKEAKSQIIELKNQITESKNQITEPTNPNNVTIIKKVDLDKDYTYNATYAIKNLASSYTNDKKTVRYLKDIVVPYVNINSDDAKSVNKEIEQLHSELISSYKEYLESNKVFYVKSKYDSYTNGNILSILITITSGGTDVPRKDYKTYNFNLETLKLVNYSDLYTSKNYTSDTINISVENEILKHINAEIADANMPENETKGTYIDASVKNYKDSIKDNSIKYFIDAKNKLNIIVNIVIPAGAGEFLTIFKIK